MQTLDFSDPKQPTTVVADAGDPWIGRTLKKHAIVARLGKGGMGVVYLAEDVVLKRAVAIKMLANTLTSDAKALERFLREARAAARLQHANVVALYDIDQDQGTHYLVMEFVPGPSAQQIIDRDGPLPWRSAVQITAEACKGLLAAHASQLIHRDVKPANLLVSHSGEVKLSDFGLAKNVSDGEGSATHGKYLVGTPNYMSPEQGRGEELDDRSDIYSLGATLYALLTGKPPFVAKDWFATMYAHATMPAPDPRRIAADVPEACVQVMTQALAKSRADRYQSAREMLAALEGLLGTERVELGPLARSFELPRPGAVTASPTLDVQRSWFRAPGRRLALAVLAIATLLAGTAALLCAGAAAWHWWHRPGAPARPETPAAVSVDQLRDRLVARNPAFNGQVECDKRAGQIVGVSLVVDDITDISPLGELSNLTEVELKGTPGKRQAPLSDINPLAGLKKLTRVHVGNCKVKNIDALRELPMLADVYLGGTDVESVRALRGLPITRLRLGGSPVKDIRGIEGAPLEELELGSCHSLASIDGLPTRDLRRLIMSSTLVPSLAPLAGAKKLEALDFHWTKLTIMHRPEKVEQEATQSLSRSDMDVLCGLISLKMVTGEFTPGESERLRQAIPGLRVEVRQNREREAAQKERLAKKKQG